MQRNEIRYGWEIIRWNKRERVDENGDEQTVKRSKNQNSLKNFQQRQVGFESMQDNDIRLVEKGKKELFRLNGDFKHSWPSCRGSFMIVRTLKKKKILRMIIVLFLH